MSLSVSLCPTVATLQRACRSLRYCVSTVGLDEAEIRRYIQDPDKMDSAQDHLKFA